MQNKILPLVYWIGPLGSPSPLSEMSLLSGVLSVNFPSAVWTNFGDDCLSELFHCFFFSEMSLVGVDISCWSIWFLFVELLVVSKSVLMDVCSSSCSLGRSCLRLVQLLVVSKSVLMDVTSSSSCRLGSNWLEVGTTLGCVQIRADGCMLPPPAAWEGVAWGWYNSWFVSIRADGCDLVFLLQVGK